MLTADGNSAFIVALRVNYTGIVALPPPAVFKGDISATVLLHPASTLILSIHPAVLR